MRSFSLYGMAIHQAYRYYRLGFDDSVYTKLYVSRIVRAETGVVE